MSLTPRDNLRLLATGERPAWIPFTVDVGSFPGFTDPILRRFREETGATDPAAWFDFDYRAFSLPARYGGDDPRALHADLPDDEPITFDEWGIGHATGGMEGTYERMLSPLAKAASCRDVVALPEPILEAPDGFAQVDEFHRQGYAVFGYAGSIYEWSWWLRGMEQFLMDLLAEPAMAEAIVRKVAGYTRRLALATARAGIDVLCFYDDAGWQHGMQISPELWRRLIKPAWAEVLDAVRREIPHALFFLHSCGDIRPIVPDVVDLGFHILHPLQPECMDPAEVKGRFGDRIALCATVSAQRTFPFGTPDEVRTEVRRLKRELGADNRCLICPSNRIQPETPWENIVAFVEEARGRPA
jgi:uroporphyrinogen decarboxylase